MSTLCNPIDYTVHGILQARILKWVAFPFSRGSSQPRDRTQISCIAGRFFTNWDIREAKKKKKKTVVIVVLYMAGLSTVFTLSQDKPRIFNLTKTYDIRKIDQEKQGRRFYGKEILIVQSRKMIDYYI